MTTLPTKDQAIILESINGLKVEDYAVAVGNLIEPINIRYFSRLSRGRVCLYLSSKTIAEKLTDKPEFVNIKNDKLQIKPLIPKSKRVIISNVDPVIPASLIVEELQKINVNPTSSIMELKAATSAPGFEHVHSFRRHMYVTLEDVEKIPEYLQIHLHNAVYWI